LRAGKEWKMQVLGIEIGGLERNIARIIEGFLLLKFIELGVPYISLAVGGVYWVGVIVVSWVTVIVAQIIFKYVPDKWR